MRHVVCCLLLGTGIGGLVSAPAGPAIDQLIESVAPVLQEGEAYHMPADTRETPDMLSLSLAQCVDLALAQNAEALIAETEVALREAQSGQARARRLPQVGVGAAYNYIEELDYGLGGGFLGGFIDTESFSPEKETVTTRLTVKQVLFAGGQIYAAVKSSRYLAQSEGWRRDAVLAEVAFQVRRAYHDALLARAAASVAEEALVAFERHLRDTTILEQEGALTSFEVMRAKTEVAARNADLVSARASVELADLALRRILALPDNQPLLLDADLPWEPLDRATPPLEQARGQRAELRALRDALSAAEYAQRGVRGTYLPEAAATVTWMEVDGGGQSSPDGWQVNVGAQWDLYLGGHRKHARAEARARTERLRHELADLERQVAAEVAGARVRLDEAAAAIRAGHENVALAEESVRLSEIRYREGIGIQTEILDSELERARARRAGEVDPGLPRGARGTGTRGGRYAGTASGVEVTSGRTSDGRCVQSGWLYPKDRYVFS